MRDKQKKKVEEKKTEVHNNDEDQYKNEIERKASI